VRWVILHNGGGAALWYEGVTEKFTCTLQWAKEEEKSLDRTSVARAVLPHYHHYQRKVVIACLIKTVLKTPPAFYNRLNQENGHNGQL